MRLSAIVTPRISSTGACSPQVPGKQRSRQCEVLLYISDFAKQELA